MGSRKSVLVGWQLRTDRGLFVGHPRTAAVATRPGIRRGIKLGVGRYEPSSADGLQLPDGSVRSHLGVGRCALLRCGLVVRDVERETNYRSPAPLDDAGRVWMLCADLRLVTPDTTPTVVRTSMFVIGGVLVAGGLAAGRLVPRAGERSVGFGRLLVAVSGLAMAVVWLVPFGRHSFIDGAIAVERGVTIASSTKMPWTVLFASFWSPPSLRVVPLRFAFANN